MMRGDANKTDGFQEHLRARAVKLRERRRRHSEDSQQGQSRAGSVLESMANVAVGYSIAVLAQWIVLAQYGSPITLSVSLKIGGWMTLVSLVRSYLLRRFFNSRRA